jgi:hypothetical protein
MGRRLPLRETMVGLSRWLGTGAGERLRAYFSQKCPLTRLTESGLLKSWQGISRSIEAVLTIQSLAVTMLKHSSLCCDRISC